jgi:DNA-directed RNA polymerase specialized sigma24 family protein
MHSRSKNLNIALRGSSSLATTSKLAARALVILDRKALITVVEQLIIKGQETGHLTKDELTEALPTSSPAEAVLVAEAFESMGIGVVEDWMFPIAAFIQDIGAVDPEWGWTISATAKAFDSRTIEQLDRLTPRERRILTLYYGLIDGKAQSTQEIANRFDTGVIRVERTRTKALAKMKTFVEEDLAAFQAWIDSPVGTPFPTRDSD